MPSKRLVVHTEFFYWCILLRKCETCLRSCSCAGVVESLINSGKQIDAVHLAHAFQLTKSFPLVTLLQTYLKDLRRNSQGKKGGAGSGQVLFRPL